MTVYLFMHPLDDAPPGATLLRLNALRALRDELSALPGMRVSAMPQGSDLEVEITNVIATTDAPGIMNREDGPRILVVRMGRNGERLDFVCSDGPADLSAERQAARRIRNWIAGEDFMSMAGATGSSLRAIA